MVFLKIFRILSLALAIILSNTVAASNTNQSFPLCQICACQFLDNESRADVNCNSHVSHDIYKPYFWKNETTNQTYAYNAVTIQYNQFTNLTDIFPTSVLTYFNLANNDINGIADSVFQNLQDMKTLILSHNDLEIIHPHAFKGQYLAGKLMPLKSLREMRLDNNKLHTLNQDLFEHTIQIEILDLSDNPLVTIDVPTHQAIASLAYLKELYLQNTKIKSLPDTMLHSPKYLQILDLSGNPIEEMPDTLGEVQSLTDLYMNNTNFINLTADNGFPKMPTLKVLHLSRNEHLCHIQNYALGGLTNLEILVMSHNNELVQIDPFALTVKTNNSGGVVWPPLKELYIQNNKLAYLESDILARWDGLSMLDIGDNPWTCECENQWLIEELMPIYLKIHEDLAKQVRCAAPIEMVHYTLYDLYQRKSRMRCLDLYGARPENDAIMLVGVLAGVLIAIPAILFLIFAYQRRWFSILGICDKSPASYSRRYYSASATDENF